MKRLVILDRHIPEDSLHCDYSNYLIFYLPPQGFDLLTKQRVPLWYYFMKLIFDQSILKFLKASFRKINFVKKRSAKISIFF